MKLNGLDFHAHLTDERHKSPARKKDGEGGGGAGEDGEGRKGGGAIFGLFCRCLGDDYWVIGGRGIISSKEFCVPAHG